MPDLSDAVRSLARSRGFTIAAILTLAIGIGATTAIYSVVDTILLQPLPFPDSDRLVRVIENAPPFAPGRPMIQRGISHQEFLDWHVRPTGQDAGRDARGSRSHAVGERWLPDRDRRAGS